MSRSGWQILFWCSLLAVVALALWLLSSILLPFLAGLVIAYFLDPVADYGERFGLKRAASALIALTLFGLVLVLVFVLVVPPLQTQIAGLIAQSGTLLESLRSAVLRLLSLLDEELPPATVEQLKTAVNAKLGDVVSLAGVVITQVLSSGIALANLLSLVFITPVVAFFLLRDWDRMTRRVDSWLPLRHRATIREQARLVDESLSGYLRGQAWVCLVLGTFYGVALSAAGLAYGFAIGAFVGLLVIVPYLGALAGGVLSLGLSLTQFQDWRHALMVLGIFLVGQAVEGNYLSPKLVGRNVHLHPVWVMFALLAFGALFGFTGLILAMPLAAITGVLARFALARYLASPLYDPRPRVRILQQTTPSPAPLAGGAPPADSPLASADAGRLSPGLP